MATARQTSSQQISPGQAAYVLERLISDRRISMGEVNRYLSNMNGEIEELEQRLERLRGINGASSAPRRQSRSRQRSAGASRGGGTKAASQSTTRRRRRVTPEQLASRQLQGRYLALVRRYPANRRAHFAKVAKERGREAAIKEMQDGLKK
jgi:TolA-binding protein